MKKNKLYNALQKLNRIVGSNNIMDICQYIKIEPDRMLATDMTRTIIVYIDTGLDCIVDGTKFINLIRNINEEVELNFDDKLVIKGNGTHTLQHAEKKFPDFDFEGTKLGEFHPEEVKTIISRHKDTYTTDSDLQHMMNFNLTDRVVTTNGHLMAITNQDLVDLFVPADLFNMLSLFDEGFEVYKESNRLNFKSDNLRIIGNEAYNIDAFPDISGYYDLEFDNYVTMDATDLKNILQRKELFVKGEFGYAVVIDTEDLTIQDYEGHSVEDIEPVENEGAFSCMVDINDLLLVLSNIDDEVTISHDEESPAIKVNFAGATSYFISVVEV